MTNQTQPRTTLVLGGTGKTGHRVLERLKARGVPTRIGSRSAELPFDWNDQATWAPAVAGVDAVYVSYYPDLAVPGAPEAVKAFSDVAVGAGVQQLVLLSGRGEEEAQAAEVVVQDAGVDFTIVRASWFAQNFSEDYLVESILNGAVYLPVQDVPEPFIDVNDIADVAVAALTEDGHAGQIYEVTGPRLLTFEDAVGEIAKAVNRQIELVKIPPEDFAAAAAADGVPDDVVGLLLYLFTTVLDGRNAHVTDGVQRALGRAPRDFYDYAWDAAATGVWDVEVAG